MWYMNFELNFSATSDIGFQHNGKELLNPSLDSWSITFINVMIIKSPAKFDGCWSGRVYYLGRHVVLVTVRICDCPYL
jgi:hypothetical protein